MVAALEAKIRVSRSVKSATGVIAASLAFLLAVAPARCGAAYMAYKPMQVGSSSLGFIPVVGMPMGRYASTSSGAASMGKGLIIHLRQFTQHQIAAGVMLGQIKYGGKTMNITPDALTPFAANFLPRGETKASWTALETAAQSTIVSAQIKNKGYSRIPLMMAFQFFLLDYKAPAAPYLTFGIGIHKTKWNGATFTARLANGQTYVAQAKGSGGMQLGAYVGFGAEKYIGKGMSLELGMHMNYTKGMKKLGIPKMIEVRGFLGIQFYWENR